MSNYSLRSPGAQQEEANGGQEELDEESVKELDDDELFARLKHYGVDVGPIVGNFLLQWIV